MLRRILKSCLVVAIWQLMVQGAVAQPFPAEQESLFGPITLLRATGKPVRVEYSFPKLPSFEEPFEIHIQNGEDDGTNRVSSATIQLNGRQIVRPSDFDQGVASIVREVDLRDDNTLIAVLRSKPGSFIKIALLGERVPDDTQVLAETSGGIGPAGGSVTLENIAQVTLEEGPTRPPLQMTVQQILSPQSLLLYRGETTGAGPSLEQLIRLISSENIESFVALRTQIPRDFAEGLPPDHHVELFAQVVQIGADGEVISTFEPLGTTYDPVHSVAYAAIPPFAFTPTNSVTTTIVVGSYPNAPTSDISGQNFVPSGEVRTTSNDLLDLSGSITATVPPALDNPLPNEPQPTSEFGERIHPVTGQQSFHNGVDYSSDGEAVGAAFFGRVIRSGPQVPCTVDEDGVCRTGFGHRVTVRDEATGVEVVYAHLEPDGLPAVGDLISPGDFIGTSDTTGTATGPHLHLEVRQNGRLLDPELLIGGVDVQDYLSSLSVVTQVNGRVIEDTRRVIDNQNFQYSTSLDLVPLNLEIGSTSHVSIVLQNTAAISRILHNFSLIIEALPLRVTLTWDKFDTDVDLHVRDSNGNHSWFGDLCGIPNGCLDRDDIDGFGPEVFDLTEISPGVTYEVSVHYFSDHGNGTTIATVVVEQDDTVFGPFRTTLANGEEQTVGVFPQ